jgi:hypothetical protein
MKDQPACPIREHTGTEKQAYRQLFLSTHGNRSMPVMIMQLFSAAALLALDSVNILYGLDKFAVLLEVPAVIYSEITPVILVRFLVISVFVPLLSKTAKTPYLFR